jgi:hypothetical protein
MFVRLFRYMFETPKQNGFVKQTEKLPKQIEFQFFKVQTENIFFLFRGHPIIKNVAVTDLDSTTDNWID